LVVDKVEADILVALADQHTLALLTIQLQDIQQQLQLVLAEAEKVLLVIF
jgi:hypothetical protein